MIGTVGGHLETLRRERDVRSERYTRAIASSIVEAAMKKGAVDDDSGSMAVEFNMWMAQEHVPSKDALNRALQDEGVEVYSIWAQRDDAAKCLWAYCLCLLTPCLLIGGRTNKDDDDALEESLYLFHANVRPLKLPRASPPPDDSLTLRCGNPHRKDAIGDCDPCSS